MGVIPTTNIISGTNADIQYAGTPTAGTDEIQTLTFGDTWLDTETFKLKFDGHETAAITWSATNNTLRDRIDTALEALANIGTSGVTTAVGTMTNGIGTITVTFIGNNAKKNVALMTVTETSADGTLACATTTAGVDATGRGAARGTELIDTDTGIRYSQTSSNPLQPTWSQIEGTGGVATADIADDAVTYAKIQDVSATDKLLGRSTSGAGIVEEIACTASGRAILDDASADAQLATLGGTAPTGTGAIVRASSPTLVTPALGTPSAVVLTNGTGLPTAGLVDGAVTLAKTKQFISTEQTGTGSEQSVAHGLGATPSKVVIIPTELAADLAAGYDAAQGTHDGTNVLCTVTSGAKFFVIAWA